MPQHVVVDGSNIATEGRSQPSLKQLNEAVMAFIAEHPEALITVVVDATFGHRIDPKEVSEFDEAVNNNELVAPPAGAIGRGDAFVLSIANKVNAIILTNDSYQEFHGQYDWLFDEGRLIGGKPVPHIGWVFVPRLPVRGPLSRKVTAEAKRRGRGGKLAVASAETVRVGSPDASQPMPVPKAPPPVAAKSTKAAAKAEAKAAAEAKALARAQGIEADAAAAATAAAATAAAATPAAQGGSAPKGSTVNELLPFLSFVEHHPVGTSVNAIVDHYSSHGAYVRVGDVMGYVPLRLMADPAPRSAREFMKVGEAITLVVDKFVPEKRSVDLAVPGMGSAPTVPAAEPDAKPAKRSRRGGKPVAAEQPTEQVATPAVEPAPAEAAAVKPRRGAKKAASPAAAPVVEPAVPSAPEFDDTTEAPIAPAKKAAKRPAKKAAAAVETLESVESAPASEPAPVKKASAKKAAAKPAPAKDVPVKDVPVNDESVNDESAKAPVKKAAAKKAPAAKAPAKKAAKKAAS
ncbi:MAG: NYN domain-containing protein [Ilumatobacteraceae bacterium]